MMGRSPRGVLSFLDWLFVSVCVFARVYVHSVCMNHYTQFFLSLPLLNLPPPPPSPTVHAGHTSIFDDSKDTTVTPTSLEHFLLSLQYSVQELFAN